MFYDLQYFLRLLLIFRKKIEFKHFFSPIQINWLYWCLHEFLMYSCIHMIRDHEFHYIVTFARRMKIECKQTIKVVKFFFFLLLCLYFCFAIETYSLSVAILVLWSHMQRIHVTHRVEVDLRKINCTKMKRRQKTSNCLWIVNV